MIAEIISVGTELLLGDTIDTNAAYLARALTPVGIRLYRRSTVGDNADRLREAVEIALGRADVVITIGGLGPTEDDLTKETVAAVVGIELVQDPDHAAWLAQFAKARGWDVLPKAYAKQAGVPAVGRGIPNSRGTALGTIFEPGDQIAICLPGPPNEFIPMVDEHVVPYLQTRMTGTPSVIHSRAIRIVGVPESVVEERVRDLIASKNPTVAPYAKLGEVHLRVTASATDVETAKLMIDPTVETIVERLGTAVYGYDNQTLESVVVGLLIDRSLKLATAESCSGGLIAKRITDVPSASNVFDLGFIVYANDAKIDKLAVDADLIEDFGAVSPQVALAMAIGARAVANADIAVSTTGIAGPTGGTPEKPIGTVDFGVAWNGGAYTERRNFLGGRTDIAYRASQTALELVRKHLIEGLPNTDL